jgi:hypothetical protein
MSGSIAINRFYLPINNLCFQHVDVHACKHVLNSLELTLAQLIVNEFLNVHVITCSDSAVMYRFYFANK